jgi:2-methylcitrate dehydratase PrpD
MTVESSADRGITWELAAWVSGLRYEDIPEDVRHRTRDIILDTLASALAGHDATEPRQVFEMARRLAGDGESTVIGGGGLAPVGAALVNGYLITAVTVCDIHRPTTAHITPEVLPPALVVAEEEHADGRSLLTAVAAGLEVATRVGLGLDPPAFRARGWHAPGVIGPFGGAAAAGKLLGLDPDAQCDAFGVAASQAAGTYAQLGTPTIKFQQSRGSMSGLMSALAAAEGIGAAKDILAHPDGGLFAAYADGGKPEATVSGLGTEWELLQISLRPWPVAVHLQPVVTGLMHLISTDGVAGADVAKVTVEMSPTAYKMHGEVPWSERFRARLSAPFVTAVVLNDGACWLEQFTAERVTDPAINAFIRERVSVQAKSAVRDGTSIVEVVTRDNRTHRKEVLVPKGDPPNPLTTGEIESKFRSASVGVIDRPAADRISDLMADLDSLSDAATLTDLLRGDAFNEAR